MHTNRGIGTSRRILPARKSQRRSLIAKDGAERFSAYLPRASGLRVSRTSKDSRYNQKHPKVKCSIAGGEHKNRKSLREGSPKANRELRSARVARTNMQRSGDSTLNVRPALRLLHLSQSASRKEPMQNVVAPRSTYQSSAFHSANHSARSASGTRSAALRRMAICSARGITPFPRRGLETIEPEVDNASAKPRV
jgi:hypothetical protein